MARPEISPPPVETRQPQTLAFEPLPQFTGSALQESAERADSRGKRIGIFIVTYNAQTTLGTVLKRITPEVWRNVEQVVVFDDASPDSTFELAVGIQALTNLPKLKVLKHAKNLGYGGNQKAGYPTSSSKDSISLSCCTGTDNMLRSFCPICMLRSCAARRMRCLALA
jgi:cellulose synthase/poly-beta-1,6-N-acetylglucosamine synthase-like glycosyltransferase